jgi:hypothetical protein
MSIIDLERRLARLEAARHVGAPTAILSDQPIGDTAGDARAADALANWQRWTAQGKATASNGVLCLVRPELRADEWEAQYVRPT